MEFERIAGDRFTDSFVDAGSSRAAACSPFARRSPSAFACRAIRNSRYAFIKKISLAGCSLSPLKISLPLSLSLSLSLSLPEAGRGKILATKGERIRVIAEDSSGKAREQRRH